MHLTHHASADSGLDPVAMAALILSVFALSAQLLSRYLDGGRVRVTLRPLLYDPFGGIVHSVDSGEWPYRTKRARELNESANRGTAVDLAEIVLENVGRLAITVTSIQVAKRSDARRRFRRQWHHFGLPPYELTDFEPNRFVSSVDSFRLEPYSRISILVDPWLLLAPGRRTKEGFTILRATAQVPGRRRSYSSPRRAWRVLDSVVTSIEAASTKPLQAVITKAIFSSDHQQTLRTQPRWEMVSSLSATIASQPWPTTHTAQRQLVREALDHYNELLGADDPDQTFILTRLIVDAIRTAGATIEWPSPRHPGP